MSRSGWVLTAIGLVALGSVRVATWRIEQRIVELDAERCTVWEERRGILGWDNPKIKEAPDGGLMIWAAGDPSDPSSGEWYDFADAQWTAIAGPRKGEVVPFTHKPDVVTLAEWRARHPTTEVLLGDRRDYPNG